MLISHLRLVAPLCLCLVALGSAAAVASPAPDAASSAPPAAVAPAVAADDDDAVLQPTEPDFRILNLPTTLRLPRGKSNFTLTHRFAGNLRRGSFADQANDLFGLDEGATIGLEYRYGVARHLEAVVYRTSFNQTWQLSAKYDAVHQGSSSPLSLSAVVADEGINNFKDDHAQALAVSAGYAFGEFASVYAVPTWVHNSAALTGITRETFYAGVGARLRVRPTVYVTAEVTPRFAGYRPGTSEYGFALEKRAGGHLFQLNVTNTPGSTYAQLARGGSPNSLSLGFNLTRKFF